MYPSTRPAVTTSFRYLFVLLAVLLLGAAHTAQAQTVTLVLTPNTDVDEGRTVTVTATLSSNATTAFSVEIDAEASLTPVGGERIELTANKTLSFAAATNRSTGVVTITAVDNDGHVTGGRMVEVTVAGTVSGITGVDDPSPVTFGITDNDGLESSTDMVRPTADGTMSTVNRNQAILVFSEALAPNTMIEDRRFHYTLSGEGFSRPVTDVEVSGNMVTFTLPEPVEAGQGVSIRYILPRDRNGDIDMTEALQDAAGNWVDRFTSVRLNNITPHRVALVLTPDEIDENGGVSTVTATLGEPAPSAFSVTVSVPVDSGVTLGSNATLAFAANATASTGEVTITATDNDSEEPNPDVTVSGAFVGSVTDVLPPRDVTLTVKDDDGGVEPAPLARGWLARFGRMAAGHAVDALGQRLRGGQRSSHLALAGRSVSPATRLADARPRDGLGQGEPAGGRSRTMDGDELLAGSSFLLHLGAAAGDSARIGTQWTVWGHGATGRFEGKDGALSLEGGTTTLTLGADADWGRMMAGVAVSRSFGDGDFAVTESCPGASCKGEVESTVTGAYPYLRFQLAERLSTWAMLGYGIGEMSWAEGGGGEKGETDFTMKMAALGADGDILPARSGGGFALALRSDLQFVRSSWDRTPVLASGETDTRRVRLRLDGSRSFEVGAGGVATPSLEIGLRHDGGDAETGIGIEVGGGFAYAQPSAGLTVEARIRSLLSHAEDDYREWGASAAIRLRPNASGRGVSLAVVPSWGAAAGGASGPRSLDAGGTPVAASAGGDRAMRLHGELGYGFGVLRQRAVLIPYAGFSLGQAHERVVRQGWRLEFGPDAVFGIEAAQRRDDAARDERLVLQGSLRW